MKKMIVAAIVILSAASAQARQSESTPKPVDQNAVRIALADVTVSSLMKSSAERLEMDVAKCEVKPDTDPSPFGGPSVFVTLEITCDGEMSGLAFATIHGTSDPEGFVIDNIQFDVQGP